ncbi:hypothetical protein RJT34_28807 [Clitoria ternatea]|uniref:Late embryogenesis abundant protein LEA-2 subgroup domain-containing protein n=1 Tax=Clitoria ternatea TaxID=43366 RepID=A0AAN9FBC3_CLITE
MLMLMVVVIVMLSLGLTIFKPKNPDISIHPTGLERFQVIGGSNANMTMGMMITITNRNYASFEYRNSTSNVKFRDTVIAQVPIVAGIAPARTTVTVKTSAEFMIGELLRDPNFWTGISNGTLNLQSSSVMPGIARMFNVFKLKATTYSDCHIAFDLLTKAANSTCVSRIKF